MHFAKIFFRCSKYRNPLLKFCNLMLNDSELNDSHKKHRIFFILVRIIQSSNCATFLSCNCQVFYLTHFSLMLHFHTLSKSTFGILTFSGGIERYHFGRFTCYIRVPSFKIWKFFNVVTTLQKFITNVAYIMEAMFLANSDIY